MTSPHYFPIAACSACDHSDAVSYDKQWLVVDDTGSQITQKECPRLAQITVAISFGYLAIRAPGMLRMDIPLDVIEDDDSVRRSAMIGTQQVDVVDEGDLAATWFTNFMQVPGRLVKVHPDAAPVQWPD